MYKDFINYSIEIKKLKFITDSGKQLPKTAILRFNMSGKSNPIVELMGHYDQNDIFDLIDKEEDVDISQCYIDKFSLSDYRRTRNLDEKHKVKIKNFKAENSFFDSPFFLDLGRAHFYGDVFSLQDSMIAKGEFMFNSSVFETSIVNFSHLHILSKGFDFSNVSVLNGDISFKNSIFGDGKKDFQYTDFGHGEKNFINIDFGNGDVSFINTVFNDGDVSFKVSRFGNGKTDFHYAKFGKGDISFERTEFGENGVDFRTVEFGTGRINFNRSEFGKGDISFEGCELKHGKFSFKRVKFISGLLSFELAEMGNIDLSFDKTDFGETSITFYNGHFQSLSFQQCHLDHYTDLRVSRCDSIDLSNTIVRDIIDLKPFEFEEDINKIYFGGMRLIGRIFIDWKKNDVLSLIKNQTDSNNELKAEQFRTLKENFSVCGQYGDEDLSYLQFKRYEARADLEETLGKSKWAFLWAYPFHLAKHLILDKAGHYATNPARVVLTMLVTLSLFSLIYFILMVTHTGDIIESAMHPHVLNALGRGFYHSTITFFTIGYGDYFPDGVLRWISGLEGFTGVFLMSYFTVAFVRKILR